MVVFQIFLTCKTIFNVDIKSLTLPQLIMMNCFCGMVDRRKAFSLISSRDHCPRSSSSQTSDTPRAGFELAQRSLWCFYYNIGTRFYQLYVLNESELVTKKNSIKKVFLKIPQKSQENICGRVSLATVWKPANWLNTESSTGGFLLILRNL